MNCPLSGQSCPHLKGVTVSETNGNRTQKFQLCHLCAPEFITQGTIPQAAPLKPTETVKVKTPLTAGQVLKNFFCLLGFNVTKQESKVIEVPVVEPVTIPEPVPTQQEAPDNICPNCGITIEEITVLKKMGCAYCYDFFQSELLADLTGLHGGIKHVGKVPKRWKKEKSQRSVNECVKFLKTKMDEVIKVENYETAANIRDSLKAIEGIVTQQKALKAALDTALSEENLQRATQLRQEMRNLSQECQSIFQQAIVEQPKPPASSDQ